MIPLVSSCLFLYVLFRLIIPLPVSRKTKSAAALPLLLISQQHLLYRLYFGSMASPELPQAVLVTAGWLFISLLYLFLLLLLRDIIRIVLPLARLTTGRRTPLIPSRGKPMPVPGILALIALVLSAFSTWQAIRVPDTRNVEVVLERLPEELDGFRLAHLADIHASALLPEPRVRAIVDKVNALQPDLILISGDIVDGTPRRREKDVAPLADLRARYGVFACAGNHEYYADFPGWMEAFARMGITMLNNRHVMVGVKGKSLVVAGMTDEVAGRFGLANPDREAALAGAPGDAVRLLLAHRPGTAAANAAAGADMQLSGHTHGGHIIGMDRIVARYNAGFVSGLYTVNRMLLYVNNGAGLWSGFPARLGVPSEITLIVLRVPRKGGTTKE